MWSRKWWEPPSPQWRLENGWNFNAGWTISLRKKGKWTLVVHHFGEGSFFYWECPLIPVLITVLSNKTMNSWVEASKGFYYFMKTQFILSVSYCVFCEHTQFSEQNLDDSHRIHNNNNNMGPGLVWIHPACCMLCLGELGDKVSCVNKGKMSGWSHHLAPKPRAPLPLKKSRGTPALLQGWLHVANWLEANNWETWDALKETICV